MGNRTPEGRKDFVQYHKAAIEVPSEATNQIEAISSKYEVFLVVGVIERDHGTLYCTIVFVHPVKGLIGKHRKIMPTASERLVWGFGDGSTLPVFEEAFRAKDSQEEAKVKISATICW
jgi:predicted amidohydrolase